MRPHRIEIFEQTVDTSVLHFDTPAQSRVLDRDGVDALVSAVEDVYSRDATAPVVFESVVLLQLGRRLHAFVDGDERWLSPLSDVVGGVVLHVDADERFRHLPWELLVHDTYLAVDPVSPVLAARVTRRVDGVGEPVRANRPLRVMFMATSPEGVEPELEYEAEEAAILESAARTGIELVVEESGTLEGLRFEIESYGAGYFDVLHLTGHADVVNSEPVFVVENDLGGPEFATAGEISEVLGGQWPRMVFVSGCLTGSSPGHGAVPSMSEHLVKAGAPAVLGWALPVGDRAATLFASSLYGSLAAGKRLDQAIVTARRDLFTDKNPFWHFLRLYSDGSPLGELVPPIRTEGRARLQVVEAAASFLDLKGQIRVASRRDFVGRRRLMQHCLKLLKQPLDRPEGCEGIVLKGMGGLGKSTVASRLLERMPTHQRVVYFGRVDEPVLLQGLEDITYDSIKDRNDATAIVQDSAPLDVRLRYLLSGPLATVNCLFVFDDFEQGNLESRADGSWVCTREAADIVGALVAAIGHSNNASRVIVTSRYQFPDPSGGTLQTVNLETLSSNELTKKLRTLEHLGPGSRIDKTTRDRAIDAAAANPRLLEWLNIVVGDPQLDADTMLAAIETKAAEFREDILAEKLIESGGPELGQLLARLNVVQLPMPRETVEAICPGSTNAELVERAVELALIEQGIEPATGQARYFVSNVLRTLLEPKLPDNDRKDACATAARSLYELWVQHTPTGNDNQDEPT